MIDFEAIWVGIALLAGLAMFAFWVWMLVHCVTNRALDGAERLLWVVFFLVAKPVGAAAYFFFRYRPRPALPARAV